ncbi:Transcriptional regulator PadR-like family protein [uncultured archaeon]|nr:Transcriptional regulator PadR-like family protein [uncultured archaeon]
MYDISDSALLLKLSDAQYITAGQRGMFMHDCCDMRGLLSFLVLFILSEKRMHGQEIAGELERRRGGRPSPGTIYPALKALKEAGLIAGKGKGNQITYSLTPAGKKVLKEAKIRFCRTFIGIT